MKQVLIGGLSVLAMIVGVTAANAQANINPNLYPGNTSERYGATAPWEWHAGPGPVKRGGNCVADVDINREAMPGSTGLGSPSALSAKGGTPLIQPPGTTVRRS